MIVYSIMVVYIFIIGAVAKQRVTSGAALSRYNNNTTLSFAILIFALPVFFIGMRSYVADSSAYIRAFQSLKPDFSSLSEGVFKTRGYGWVLLEVLIKKYISSDYSVFFMIIAIFQSGALIKLYYRYSLDYPFSVLLFFLSCSFIYMLNGLREFTAVCLILYFSDYIFNKKYIKFILIVLLATTIHIAAIVWLVAIFLVQGKPGNWRIIVFGFVVLLAIAYIDQFTNLLEDSLVGTSYEGYTNQFEKDSGSNIAHSLVAVIPVAISLWGKNRLKNNADNITKVLINVAVLCLMSSVLANFSSGLLIGRITIFFTPFTYALLPRLFLQAVDDKDGHTLRALCGLFYTVYFVYYIYHTHFIYHSSVLGMYEVF